MFTLICARINDWVNNRKAGDLRRHRGHYDVNVMTCQIRRHCDVLRYWLLNKMATIWQPTFSNHYNDVKMSAVASQITSASIVCSTVGSGAYKRKHQNSTSLGFVWVKSRHKRPVTRKMFPFHDVIMCFSNHDVAQHLITPPGFLAILDLTYWGRDEISPISQVTFSNAFPWIKYMNFA